MLDTTGGIDESVNRIEIEVTVARVGLNSGMTTIAGSSVLSAIVVSG
jgi:hypothetical protein